MNDLQFLPSSIYKVARVSGALRVKRYMAYRNSQKAGRRLSELIQEGREQGQKIRKIGKAYFHIQANGLVVMACVGHTDKTDTSLLAKMYDKGVTELSNKNS